MAIKTRFKQQINIIILGKHAIHLNNVGVIHVQEDHYLSGKLILQPVLFNYLFWQDFHGTNQSYSFVSHKVNLSKLSLSKSFPQNKII
jgi:hypothetical protein